MSVRSIERRPAAWEADGEQGLYSKGPASLPKLSPAQFRVSEEELRKGPAAHGWADQRWTLARMTGRSSPTLELRRNSDGGMFDRYTRHFDNAWNRARDWAQ